MADEPNPRTFKVIKELAQNSDYHNTSAIVFFQSHTAKHSIIAVWKPDNGEVLCFCVTDETDPQLLMALCPDCKSWHIKPELEEEDKDGTLSELQQLLENQLSVVKEVLHVKSKPEGPTDPTTN